MVVRPAPVVCAAIAIAAIGCRVEETVVARVGRSEVSVLDVQAYVESATGMPWQAVDRRAAEAMFDQFIDQEVMFVRARIDDIGGTPPDPARRSAAVRAAAVSICGEPPAPSDEVVERELARIGDELRPARVRVRQMLLDSRGEAEEMRRRLESGEVFAELSAEFSRAANASQGGDLGWISVETLPEDLERVVFSLAEGEISDPVSSPAGYHVFQVLEVAPEGPASPAEAEVEVRRRLASELAREFASECVAAAATSVGVRVFEDHLWFDYDGRYGEDGNGP
jgi:hypothetical protein